MVKKTIKASSSKDFSKDNIKIQLFDYLCELGLDIDGYPAEDIVNSIANLRPVFSVSDILDVCYESNCSIVDAVSLLEDEADEM